MTFHSDPDDVTIHDSGWVTLPSGARMTRLPLWDDHHGLFARLGPGQAADLLSGRDMRLPSKAELDELHEAAMFIAPYTLPTPSMVVDAGVPKPWYTEDGRDSPAMSAYRVANMRSRAWCAQHDEEVFARLRDAGWAGEPVSNAGKHWGEGGHIYGWWRESRKPIQGWSAAHKNEATFTDYATTTHAVMARKESYDEGKDSSEPSSVPPMTSPGDDGPDVKAWQRYLLRYFSDRGQRALPVHGVDGDHGTETQSWTTRWEVLQVPDTDPAPTPSGSPLDCSYVQAANYTRAGRELDDVWWIVLHSTENPVRDGVAGAVARWFAGPSAPRASAHYIVGPDETIQCVRLSDVAWAAPGANRHGVQVEQVGQALKTNWEGEGWFVLKRSAQLVAALCAKCSLEPTFVDAAGLIRGTRGITTHYQVTEAFKRSDHVDPFGTDDRRGPIDRFLAEVEKHM